MIFNICLEITSIYLICWLRHSSGWLTRSLTQIKAKVLLLVGCCCTWGLTNGLNMKLQICTFKIRISSPVIMPWGIIPMNWILFVVALVSFRLWSWIIMTPCIVFSNNYVHPSHPSECYIFFDLNNILAIICIGD